jgi:hypothetical protein
MKSVLGVNMLFKSPLDIAEESKVSKMLVHTATKLLKSELYNTTAVHELQPE